MHAHTQRTSIVFEATATFEDSKTNLFESATFCCLFFVLDLDIYESLWLVSPRMSIAPLKNQFLEKVLAVEKFQVFLEIFSRRFG